MKTMRTTITVLSLFLSGICSLHAQQGKSLELEDIMKFQHSESPSISEDGKWVTHVAAPDRGDSDVLVYSSNGKEKYHIEGADKPVFSNDGNWVAMSKVVPALDLENAGKDRSKSPKPGLVLLNTASGEQLRIDSVSRFLFSNDSRSLFVHRTGKDNGKKEGSELGSDLQVIGLPGMEQREIPFVKEFMADSTFTWLAYIVSDTLPGNNGVYIDSLAGGTTIPLVKYDSATWSSYLTWCDSRDELVFLLGDLDEEGNRLSAALWSWRPQIDAAEEMLSDGDLEPGWRIYHKNRLTWSDDGLHLFLGTKPEDEIIPPGEEDKDSITDLFNKEEILAKREVDVWHWDDPFINTHQKKRWKREKHRTYTGVVSIRNGKFTQLADREVPGLRVVPSALYAIGYSDLPYRKRMTWDGSYYDFYVVNVESGNRQLVAKELQESARISPDGEHVAWYNNDHWHLMNAVTGERLVLNESLAVPFYDEDWDYPADRPGYGIAGWIAGATGAVLIYDKFDIWKFPFDGGEPVCMTEGRGRETGVQFRIKKLDDEKLWYKEEDEVLLTGYHDLEKHRGIYGMKIGEPGVSELAGGAYRYSLVAQAEDADRILFTRETYREFPDLWVTNGKFRKLEKLSDLGSQTDGFAWGDAELVEWMSVDGRPIQGILIKPGNYEPGKQYPVLVYYYRFFTPRMYSFPDMLINHRPVFPYYASNDYAVFLPDIRFDIGTPGYAATKCLVPGVQNLIDMGIADPAAVGLHGHSWSGYQTAFVITQTDLFACAIAGAPVSNMTSAYSGIRWGSGLARQFQYEKSQSRIGGSLWEARDKYIENSPVFYADRIETPLLIQFGDKDEAVPWYQGIELYLAMRRLEKDCIFLQYRGEPHHLKKYANQLDYTIKFREYLDHYLKGEAPAAWIEEGVEYRGE